MPSSFDREAILHRTRKRLVDRGFQPLRDFKDRGGLHCCLLAKWGDYFYLVAKEQVWDDKASFLQRTARRAADNTSLLVCYFLDREECYVFDAEFVRERGDESIGKSKKYEVEWFEVPMSAGVPLDDYMLQRDSPTTLADIVGDGGSGVGARQKTLRTWEGDP